jgi:hypothetical protein
MDDRTDTVIALIAPSTKMATSGLSLTYSVYRTVQSRFSQTSNVLCMSGHIILYIRTQSDSSNIVVNQDSVEQVTLYIILLGLSQTV